MPHHMHSFQYLFLGYAGKSGLVPWAWISQLMGLGALFFLLFPKIRKNEGALGFLAVAVILALWIEKGLLLVITGFVPNPMGKVVEYWPTFPEGAVTIGIYAIGALLLTGLYKIAIATREEVGTH